MTASESEPGEEPTGHVCFPSITNLPGTDRAGDKHCVSLRTQLVTSEYDQSEYPARSKIPGVQASSREHMAIGGDSSKIHR